MSDAVQLKAKKREEVGSGAMSKLRVAGALPGIVYGRKKDPVSVSLSERDFMTAFHKGARIFELDLGGQKETTILKDVQYDHLGDKVLHADFSRISLTEKIRVKIPVHAKGTPVGAKEGGQLVQPLHELEVECLPTAIPEDIRVDVSVLEINKHMALKDLSFPSGVAPIGDPESVVFALVMAKEEEPAAPAAEGEAKAPEILTEKKKEGEEGAAPAK